MKDKRNTSEWVGEKGTQSFPEPHPQCGNLQSERYNKNGTYP